MKTLQMNDPLPLLLGLKVNLLEPPKPPEPVYARKVQLTRDEIKAMIAPMPVDIDLTVKWVGTEELAYSDLRHPAFAAHVEEQMRAARKRVKVVPAAPTDDEVKSFYKRAAVGDVGESERMDFEGRLAAAYATARKRVSVDAFLGAAEELAEKARAQPSDPVVVARFDHNTRQMTPVLRSSELRAMIEPTLVGARSSELRAIALRKALGMPRDMLKSDRGNETATGMVLRQQAAERSLRTQNARITAYRPEHDDYTINGVGGYTREQYEHWLKGGAVAVAAPQSAQVREQFKRWADGGAVAVVRPNNWLA